MAAEQQPKGGRAAVEVRVLRRVFVGIAAVILLAEGTAAGPMEDAAEWYRLAAEQGHRVAQFNLGVLYFNGEGVPQDYMLAYMWFKFAAANGDVEAIRARDFTSTKMTIDQIAEAQRLARDWKLVEN